MSPSERMLLFATVGLSAWSGQVTAQSDSAKACDKAAKTVQKGHPAHKEQAALNTLLTCGSMGATVTAGALAHSGMESDTDVLTSFYFTVNAWRDADIMSAAMQLAGDPGATFQSRVYAISHLLKLLTPGAAWSYGILVAGAVPSASAGVGSGTSGGVASVTPPCRHGFSSDNAGNVGTPLPPGYYTQITSLLGRLATDTSVPMQVQNAAECAQYSP